MKIFVLMILAFFSAKNSFSFEVKELRRLYYEASKNPDAADFLHQKLEKLGGKAEPILMGYKAMAQFMICHHSFNPYTKLKYFFEGKKILDAAVAAEPDNLELRYMRFSVQTNAPGFLNYTQAISQDKKFIFDKISSKNSSEIDADLKKKIFEFMLQSEFCSREEKIFLKKVSPDSVAGTE